MNESAEQSRRTFIKNAGSVIAVTAASGLTGFKPGVALAGLPKPFIQQIHLMDVHIAGTSYIPEIEDRLGGLVIGARLNFSREADNKFDPKAIAVSNEVGEKIGFIPRDQNAVLANLMDAGKLIYGTVLEMEELGSWNKITMQVFLED